MTNAECGFGIGECKLQKDRVRNPLILNLQFPIDNLQSPKTPRPGHCWPGRGEEAQSVNLREILTTNVPLVIQPNDECCRIGRRAFVTFHCNLHVVGILRKIKTMIKSDSTHLS